MTEEKHSTIALKAMERAVVEARKSAAEKGLTVPVWKNGRIIQQDPREDSEQGVPGNSYPPLVPRSS